MDTIMSSANNESFASSFLIWMPFISPCLITVARAFSSMLSKSVECRHPCPICELKGNVFIFCSLSMLLAVGFSYVYDLYYVKGWSLFSHFTESFYHKWVLDFTNCFFCIYWFDQVTFIFHFLYVIYHIYWFANILSLIPWINPTWSWCMIFLMYCCFRFTNILLRTLGSTFITDTGL